MSQEISDVLKLIKRPLLDVRKMREDLLNHRNNTQNANDSKFQLRVQRQYEKNSIIKADYELETKDKIQTLETLLIK